MGGDAMRRARGKRVVEFGVWWVGWGSARWGEAMVADRLVGEDGGEGPRTLAEVDWGRYDFLDYGCREGGSLAFCRKRFGAGRGLGIDIDPRAVAATRAAGFEAVVADVAVPREPLGAGLVRFVAMMDFLEHLPDIETVERVLGEAATTARDFLFIRHPSFEGEAYLTELGLRQFWWYWRSMRVHFDIADICTMFDRLGLHRYHVRYRLEIQDSSHPSVLRNDEAIDQHSFDPVRHRPKPVVGFTEPIWRAQDIFVALRPFAPEEWNKVTGPA